MTTELLSKSVFALLIAFLPAARVDAQVCDVTEDFLLAASDADEGDWFGYSVDVDGDWSIIGGMWNDDFGLQSGSAYLFRRDPSGGTDWEELVKIHALDAQPGDQFGVAVAIHGDYAIIGANRSEDAGQNTGSAYIFRRREVDPPLWSQVAKLVASDAASGDWFGSSVSINGDTVVVGAFRKNGGGTTLNEAGAAYVFQRDFGGLDMWGEVAKLTASDLEGFDHFGDSVAIYQDTIIIGSLFDDEACPNDPSCGSGSAYVFERDYGGQNQWGEVAKLLASDADAGDVFGNSVALVRDTAVIGADSSDDGAINSGSAYIFERDTLNPHVWSETTKITPFDPSAAALFGCTVSIENDTVVISAPYDDEAEPDDWECDSGSVYLYRRDLGGVNNWGLFAKLTSYDAVCGDRFGQDISISHETIFVGAPLTGGYVDAYGNAYVYDSISCPLESGDCDEDSDIDLVDFAMFQLCFTGQSGVVLSANCECSDFDADEDVDLVDFAAFQLAFTGALP